jgi:A/G-specific adenine glycosylase
MTVFARQLIQWQRLHGRHDLPWQNTRDPYAIWVSEIMLQQTQVAAVVPYYQRFMARFPTVTNLAEAEQDTVLQHWSGLGYYSRARNLHRAAQMVVQQHRGIFPQSLEQVQQLPGIGRSTAAAILAFAFGQRQAILDGNVKRVLTRYLGIAGWPGQPTIEKQLWQAAERLLPEQDVDIYTQGLMDLGATLCTRTRPGCADCPLVNTCVAYHDGLTAQLPTPKPRKAIPEKQVVMLLLLDGNEVLLEKRPPSGIWGGLWSLPEVAAGGDVQQVALRQYGVVAEALAAQPVFVHTFTHFRLHITPQPLRVIKRQPQLQQPGVVWLDKREALGAALPTAVRTLLKRLQ